MGKRLLVGYHNLWCDCCTCTLKSLALPKSFHRCLHRVEDALLRHHRCLHHRVYTYVYALLRLTLTPPSLHRVEDALLRHHRKSVTAARLLLTSTAIASLPLSAMFITTPTSTRIYKYLFLWNINLSCLITEQAQFNILVISITSSIDTEHNPNCR